MFHTRKRRSGEQIYNLISGLLTPRCATTVILRLLCQASSPQGLPNGDFLKQFLNGFFLEFSPRQTAHAHVRERPLGHTQAQGRTLFLSPARPADWLS